MGDRAPAQLQTAPTPAISRLPVGLLQRACACGRHTGTGGECAECRRKREDTLQRAAVRPGPAPEVPPIVYDVLRSPGQPLDAGTRASMETRFGQDFSGVRVHADGQAAESAAAVNARAYTVGQNVVFGDGQYAPATNQGHKLLRHELTHVIQQAQGLAGSAQALEAQAESHEQYTGGLAPSASIGHPTHAWRMQRKPDSITAITVNLATSTILLSLDDGHTISGKVTSTNLQAGTYSARWDSASNELEISPWPTRDRIIAFQVSGTRPFLQRYDQLRRAIAERIPFVVAAEAPAPQRDPNLVAPVTLPGGLVLTPEEAQRRCEANNLPGVKVFPFRGTRAGAAPISAWREGGDIVVKLPVYVLANDDFSRQTRTLPTESFISGVHLRPNELVRVHVYEPRWYHLNITGSTEGDKEQEFCVTGEQMLQIADASTTATKWGVALTVVDAATLFVPVGRLASAAARPLMRAGQTGLTAAMIGTADVAPTALAGVASRAAVTVVEEQAVTQVAGRAVTQTVSQTVVRAAAEGVAEAAPRAAQAAAPRAGAGAASSVAGQAAAHAGVSAAGGAVSPTVAQPAIAGAQQVTVTQAEYQAALRQVFPSQYLNPVARTVDGIGQRAAQRAMADPRFMAAVQNRNWTLAGTLFHSAAAQEARAVPAAALPAGWTLEAERVIQAGAGGSRADLLLRGPGSLVVEFDWKTTGRSALSYSSRQEMARHAGQITTRIGGTLTTQESRSWIDYMRALMPGVPWP